MEGGGAGLLGEVGRGWGIIIGKEAHGRKRERGAGLMGK